MNELSERLSGYLVSYEHEPEASDYFIPLTPVEVKDLIAALKQLQAVKDEHENVCGCEGEACWFGSKLAELEGRP